MIKQQEVINRPTYKITATLLNSWLYYLSSSQDIEEFVKVLKKEPIEDNQGYLLRGEEFEKEVYNKQVKEINNIIEDTRCYQTRKEKDLEIKIDNQIIKIRVVGIADFIYKNCVFDIKRVSEYHLAHYLNDTTQHYIYCMLFNAKHFKYLIYDNNEDLHIESYDESVDTSTNKTISIISQFIQFLKRTNLYMLYTKNWRL